MILNDFYQYLIKAGYKAQEDYVLFSGPTSFTVSFNINKLDGKLYYSVDGVNYTKWDGSTLTAVLDGSDNLYKIYLQGENNTKLTGFNDNRFILTGSNVSLSGNLLALLDAKTVSLGIGVEDALITALGGYGLWGLFRSNSAIISIKNLKINLTAPQTHVPFQNMFRDCNNLVLIPKQICCYNNTFFQPNLSNFFQNTNVSKTIIINIFDEQSKPNVGGLYRGTPISCPLPEYIYGTLSEMYRYCPNINRLPKLLASHNCSSMFRDCPNIKVSETQDSTYQYAFTLPSGGTYTDMFTNTGGSFTGTPVAGTTYYTDHPLVDAYYPLHFSSPNSFTIAQNAGTTSWDGTVEYSTNGDTWNTWDGTTITAVSDGSEYNIYFRGTGNTCLGSSSLDAYWAITGSNVDISGEIDCLLDYATLESRGTLTAASNTYRGLFYGQTALTDAQALIIDKVAGDACNSMFEGCTNLKYPPVIMATSIESYSGVYGNMFKGCTSLLETPYFPATDSTGWGYANMFEGCTSLKKGPYTFNNGNTFAAGASFYQMFLNCTSLKRAPLLPTTSIGGMCYEEMFKGCTSLATAPDSLPANMAGWEDECYLGMFNGCTSLTKAPTLPATTLTSNCYKEMFKGCTSLATAPTLPAMTMTESCYREMFQNCTGLTEAPELPATTMANNCYRDIFNGCTSLTKAPTVLPATTGSNEGYNGMFCGCTSLVVAPRIDLINAKMANFSTTFKDCTNLEVIPDLSNVTGTDDWVWYKTFEGCTKVKVYTDPSKGDPLLTGIGNPWSNTFGGTSGDYTGRAENGVTYYTSNTLI